MPRDSNCIRQHYEDSRWCDRLHRTARQADSKRNIWRNRRCAGEDSRDFGGSFAHGLHQGTHRSACSSASDRPGGEQHEYGCEDRGSAQRNSANQFLFGFHGIASRRPKPCDHKSNTYSVESQSQAELDILSASMAMYVNLKYVRLKCGVLQPD
jgi:hypothetical protein